MIESGPERIYIAPAIGLFRSILLGGAEARRSQHAGVFFLGWMEEPRDTKIDELYPAPGGDHDIGWLEITENDG